MFSWIAANIGTILICLVLLLVVTAIIVCLVRDKKKASLPAAEIAPTARCQAPATNNNHRGRRSPMRLPLIFQLEDIHGKPHLFDSLQHPVFAGRTGFGRRKRRTLR